MNNKWIRLDNAALIFPAGDKKADAQVFRFCIELYEQIDPQILQRALDAALETFDLYKYVMKRGFFWYYLEHSRLKAAVAPESSQPCSKIYSRNKKKLLFKINYYKSNIIFEFYHVLSDGMGAMQFVKLLINKYLCEKHGIFENTTDYDASRIQMNKDSFKHYYTTHDKRKKPKTQKAYMLKGQKHSENRLKIINGRMSLSAVLKLAKSHSSSLTTFLCTVLMQSITEDIPQRNRKKNVIIGIPVNLRKYFPSESARNFFSIINISSDFSKTENLDELAAFIGQQLEQELTAQNLSFNINNYAAIENNIFAKITPLRIKDIILGTAYSLSMKKNTAVLSNIGRLELDENLRGYVKAVDVCTGTNKMQTAVCSYMDTLSITFSTPFISTEIQRRFFKKLTSFGLEIEIYSNQTDD